MTARSHRASGDDAQIETQRSVATLGALAKEEENCTRCPLYREATQAVPGEGPRRAPVMMVGEQPGDREDLAGHPFVGPAGRLLDKAMADAGIDRRKVFVTNAVKHFKHEQRGKRRLHKRPNAYEIERCRWWLDLERKLVKPRLVVALGATALRSVLGRPATITSLRGEIHALENGEHFLATVHPSSLLRRIERSDKEAGYRAFVRDLELCTDFLDDT